MARKIICFFLLFAPIRQTFSQELPENWFNFWVGQWEVSWDEGGGKKGMGTNTISWILDKKVIQENFTVTEGASKGYLGTSISTYNPKNETWHQGYADNQSTYFNFIGEKSGENKIFKTIPVIVSGKEMIQRMIFHEIKSDSFIWDWEKTEDGGKTWQLNWRIFYKRIK